MRGRGPGEGVVLGVDMPSPPARWCGPGSTQRQGRSLMRGSTCPLPGPCPSPHSPLPELLSPRSETAALSGLVGAFVGLCRSPWPLVTWLLHRLLSGPARRFTLAENTQGSLCSATRPLVARAQHWASDGPTSPLTPLRPCLPRWVGVLSCAARGHLLVQVLLAPRCPPAPHTVQEAGMAGTGRACFLDR